MRWNSGRAGWVRAVLATSGTLLLAPLAGGWGAVHPAPARRQTIVVLPVTLSFAVANAVLAGDSALGPVATARLRESIAARGAYDVIAPQRVDSALAAQDAPCASEACTLRLARSLGADVVLQTVLMKVSTPVWTVHTLLREVGSARTLRADEFELKGAPEQMIPLGMESVARRVSQAALETS